MRRLWYLLMAFACYQCKDDGDNIKSSPQCEETLIPSALGIYTGGFRMAMATSTNWNPDFTGDPQPGIFEVTAMKCSDSVLFVKTPLQPPDDQFEIRIISEGLFKFTYVNDVSNTETTGTVNIKSDSLAINADTRFSLCCRRLYEIRAKK